MRYRTLYSKIDGYSNGLPIKLGIVDESVAMHDGGWDSYMDGLTKFIENADAG